MKIEDAAECIKSTVSTFASSQGFYGRLLADMDDAGWKRIAHEMMKAGMNPADDIDVVKFIEG